MKLSCAALLALICSLSLISPAFAFLPNVHKLNGINIADKGRMSPTELLAKNNHFDRRITVLKESGNSDISKPATSVFDTTVTPVIAAGIAITAFSFQVFGIFPWHARLQTGFESVKVRTLNTC